MTDENDTASAAAASNDEPKRGRSEIEFPYADLESAVELARTIHEKAGSSAELEELAPWMGQTASGGTFRTRVGAARLFGLVETGQGRATLTQFGRDILPGSSDEKASRVQAFLNVELFRAMYERFRGHALPPPAAIERQMAQMGVTPKQTERARQTFMKSATYAGFIESTTGRFVKPGIAQFGKSENKDDPPADKPGGNGGGGGNRSDDLDLDPLLYALLKKIPPSGDDWPLAQRARWFRTFAMNVSQIYDADTDESGQINELVVTIKKLEDL